MGFNTLENIYMVKQLIEHNGYEFEEALMHDIQTVGVYKEISKGGKLLEIGDYIKSIPLVISGVLKVLTDDSEGNELLLYYLSHGDTCAMALVIGARNVKSGIRVIAETDCKLILIPTQNMEEWLIKYKGWRQFVIDNYQYRISGLLEVVESFAFSNIEKRLRKYLSDKVHLSKSKIIYTTHQKMAHELNTSRVAVSRLLKKWENMGQLKIGRNYIKILKL